MPSIYNIKWSNSLFFTFKQNALISKRAFSTTCFRFFFQRKTRLIPEYKNCISLTNTLILVFKIVQNQLSKYTKNCKRNWCVSFLNAHVMATLECSLINHRFKQLLISCQVFISYNTVISLRLRHTILSYFSKIIS